MTEDNLTHVTGAGTPAPNGDGMQTPAPAEAGAAAPDNDAAQKSKFAAWLDSLLRPEAQPAGEDDKAETGGKDGAPAAPEGTPGKTYTRADIDAAVAAERARIEAERAKQEELGKLSPEEAAKRQVEELQAKLQATTLRQQATAQLGADGYPVGLADLLNYSSPEAMGKSMETVLNVFKTSLAEGITERLRGKTPEGLGAAGKAGTTTSLQQTIRDSINGGI